LKDYHLKAVRIEGAFVWHRHAETDACFFVVAGSMRIEFRDGDVRLEAGDLYIVPRGVEHRPVAEHECRVLVIEPSTTVNTGDAGGPQTVNAPEWLELPS
jgi:mannose-6-phosphate isomerase-like protein (cupin superfamily)